MQADKQSYKNDFGRRYFAALVDWPLALISAVMLCRLLRNVGWILPWWEFPLCLIYIVVLIFPYFIFFESSILQATPGKLLSGLRVENSDGGSITIWDALLYRVMQGTCCLLVVYIGYMGDDLDRLVGTPWFSKCVLALLVLGIYFTPGLIEKDPVFSRRLVVKHIQKNKTGEGWSFIKALSCSRKRQLSYVAICLLLVIGLPPLNQSLRDFVDNRPGLTKGTILYAAKDIYPDAIITKNDLEIKSMIDYRIPSNALRSVDQAVGHKCRYGALSGQIIEKHDLASNEK